MAPDSEMEPFVELDKTGLKQFFQRFGTDDDSFLFPVKHLANLLETIDVPENLTRKFYAYKNPDIGILISVILNTSTLPMSPQSQNVQLYCHPDNLDELEACLTQTRYLNFETIYTVFNYLDERLIPVLKKSLTDCGELQNWGETSVVALEPEKAAELSIKWPDEVYVRPLTTDDAILPYKRWRYHFSQSFDFFAAQVSALPSAGVFLKEDDKLVSWILVSDLGSMGFFYTLKEYRQRGYGKLALKSLSSTLGKLNLTPTACVESYNHVSYSCFQSLGFRKHLDKGLMPVFIPNGFSYDTKAMKSLIAEQCEN